MVRLISSVCSATCVWGQLSTPCPILCHLERRLSQSPKPSAHCRCLLSANPAFQPNLPLIKLPTRTFPSSELVISGPVTTRHTWTPNLTRPLTVTAEGTHRRAGYDVYGSARVTVRVVSRTVIHSLVIDGPETLVRVLVCPDGQVNPVFHQKLLHSVP